MAEFTARGAIKVQNVDGKLVPFMPDTDIGSVYNDSGVSLVQTISKMRSDITEIQERGGIKLMYEMPDAENTEIFRAKTLIGAVVPTSGGKKIHVLASISEPKNGSFFVLDESYQVTCKLFNMSDVDIADALLDVDGEEGAVVSLDVAEEQTVTVKRTVVLEDIAYCLEERRPKDLLASLTFDGSDQFEFVGKMDVQLNCLPDEQGYYDPKLTIQIAMLNSPSYSSVGYNLGETVSYQTTVSNTGHARFDGEVTLVGECTLHGESYRQTFTIDIGESRTFTDSVIVTEEDILGRQGWRLFCTAAGTSFLGQEGEFTASRSVTIAQPNPKLSVVYEMLNHPADGQAWTDGETVLYRLQITNSGNLTLTNVSVEDQHSGVSETIDSIAPGRTMLMESGSMAVEIPIGNEEGIISCNAAASASAPDGLTAAIQASKLNIVTDKSTGFQYTVDTTRINSANTTASAPFSVASDGDLAVDWGDGTSSTFTSETTDKTHSYAAAGEYVITATSSDWSKVTLVTYNSTSSITSSSNPTLYWFRNTVVSLDGMLPVLANTSLGYAFFGCIYLSSIDERLFFQCQGISSFAYCFYGCTSLASLPAGLFADCISSASFAYCFYGCSNLTDIPSTVFSGCTGATTFHSCFYGCSKLEVVPENLFKDCVGATVFHTLFRNCTKMKTIPEDLFKYNTAATDLGGVFWSCQNIQSIPEDLLRYNVAATNVGAFFCYAKGPAFASFPTNFLKYNVNVTTLTTDNYGFFEGSAVTSFSLRIGSSKVSNAQYFCYGLNASGVTRTIYVPAGSTTKATMQSYASSFALTIVEE